MSMDSGIERTPRVSESPDQFSDPTQTVVACTATMRKILEQATEYRPDAVGFIEASIKELEAAEEMNVSAEYCQAAVELVVASATRFGMDMMRVYSTERVDKNFRQMYGRETGDGVINYFREELPNGLQSQYMFLDSSLTDDVHHQVVASIVGNTEPWEVIANLDELADIPDSADAMPKLVIVDDPVSPPDIQAAVYRFGETQSDSESAPAVLMRMELDQSVTAHVLISTKESKSIPDAVAVENVGGSQIRRVNNPVPLQSQIRALLKSGLSWPFDGAANLSDAVLAGKTGTAEPASLHTLLKLMRDIEPSRAGKVFAGKAALAATVAPAEREAALKKWLGGHTTHYANLLKLGDDAAPSVWLTRSGSSANDAVIRALAKGISGEIRAYKDVSWYYENDQAVEANFKLGGIEDAQVCFIGSSDATGHTDADEFNAKRASVLGAFKTNAQAHPENQYYLVIDTTFDPLLNIPRNQFPSNLTIIRTTSWTKYQRGERNHFCGSIAASGDGLQNIDIDSAARESRASLTEDGIIHMPRITVSELEDRRVRMEERISVFKDAFSAAQSEIDPRLRHTVTANSACIYIQHPLFNAVRSGPEVLTSLVEAMKEAPSPDSLGKMSGTDIRRLNRKFFTLVDMAPQPFKNARRAESFGLPETRVDMMTEQQAGTTSLRQHLGLSPIQNLRVSPGYDDSPEAMRRVAVEMNEFLTRKYRDDFFQNAPASVDTNLIDFSKPENAWKFGHHLTTENAEKILTSSSDEEQSRRIIEYMDDVEWSLGAYERLSSSPVSTFVLSHVFSRSPEQKSASDIARFVERKSPVEEKPPLSRSFIRWCKSEIPKIPFSKNELLRLLTALHAKEEDEGIQLTRHVLSFAVNSLTEPLTSEDVANYSKQSLLTAQTGSLVIRQMLRSPNFNAEQLRQIIDSDPELRKLAYLVERVG